MSTIKRTIINTIFLAVCIASGVFNVSYGQAKADKLDKLISAYADYGKFNGSVLVAEKGKVIYKKGFGLANMEWNMPNQTDTKHRLGSITKQFTSMLIMQLVEQGKLKLDVPISTWLPDYPKKKRRGNYNSSFADTQFRNSEHYFVSGILQKHQP